MAGTAGQIYRNVGCKPCSVKLMALSFLEETCGQFWFKDFNMQQSNKCSLLLRPGNSCCFWAKPVRWCLGAPGGVTGNKWSVMSRNYGYYLVPVGPVAARFPHTIFAFNATGVNPTIPYTLQKVTSRPLIGKPHGEKASAVPVKSLWALFFGRRSTHLHRGGGCSFFFFFLGHFQDDINDNSVWKTLCKVERCILSTIYNLPSTRGFQFIHTAAVGTL